MRATSGAGQDLHQLVGHSSRSHAVNEGLDVPETVDGGKLQQSFPVTLQGHFLEVPVPAKPTGRRLLETNKPNLMPGGSLYGLCKVPSKEVRCDCSSLPPEVLVCDLVDVQAKELLGSVLEDVFQEALGASTLVPHQRRVSGLPQPEETTAPAQTTPSTAGSMNLRQRRGRLLLTRGPGERSPAPPL